MTREQIFEQIAVITDRKQVSCNCEKCRQMCQRTPCLGTPHDILALIDAGYVDKVCYTEWAAGMVLNHISSPVPMVQIKARPDGSCVFFIDGKCELHENGLKPTEGKLAYHEVSPRELLPQFNLTFQVAKEWFLEDNFGIISEIVDKMMKHLDK